MYVAIGSPEAANLSGRRPWPRPTQNPSRGNDRNAHNKHAGSNFLRMPLQGFGNRTTTSLQLSDCHNNIVCPRYEA